MLCKYRAWTVESEIQLLTLVELEQLYVQQCGVLALELVLFGGKDIVAALQYVHNVLQTVLELFVHQFIAGLLALALGLGRDKTLLPAACIQPQTFYGTCLLYTSPSPRDS